MPPVLDIGLKALLVGFTGAMMPGPLLAMAIAETVRRGRRAAIMLMVGHALIEIVFVVAFIGGLRYVLGQEAVRQAVSLAGGLFLLWMGFSALRDVFLRRVTLELGDTGAQRLRGPVVDGALISLANPYFTLWWATFGATLVLQALAVGPAGLAAFYVGHEIADFAWYGGVILAVASGRRFMGQRAYRALLGVLGAAVLGLGLYYVANVLKALVIALS